jgi:hypothetical protein
MFLRFIALSIALVVGAKLSEARAANWKPERVLGSARLSLAAVDSVYVPPEPSDRLKAAIDDLMDFWPSGLELRVAGGSAISKNSLILQRDVGVRGFSLRRIRTKVYLCASDDEALANGIYSICRDLLGARWYWEGDLGFETVGELKEKFPDRYWREKPAFIQRNLLPPEGDFGRRNRLNRKYFFNHNLAKVFTEELFDAAPEVFAKVDGVRRRPRGSGRIDAQPDFSHPKTVNLSVAAVRKHFMANPNANSFSLSINDNSLFDEGPETEAIVVGKGRDGRGEVEYFRGRPNYTDLVFGFANAVAERVFCDPAMRQTASGEDRYVTALAYYWTEQSPSFPIHPRVMPVLTSDRAQWHDPAYRAQDKALIERWVESGAERIATWDYYYGSPYPYPRGISEWIGESIPFLSSRGVDVFFSQLPSVWGLDGPKAWLAAQLLWDPDQNVEDLLDEFYVNFFGPAAGPIRKFYEIAESNRNQNEGPANWIKFYKDEAGIELFDERTLAKMRACIRAAEALVAGDPQRAARVRIVSEAFSYSEAYARYHRCRVALVELSLGVFRESKADLQSLLRALADYREAREAFRALSRDLVKDPMHRGFFRFNRLLKSDPEPIAFAALAVLGEEPGDAEFLDEDQRASYTDLLAVQDGTLTRMPIGHNSELEHSGAETKNFLGPEIPVIDGWKFDFRASEGVRIGPAMEEGMRGVRVENADIVTLQQTFPVMSETTYLLEIDAAWKVSPDNRSSVQLNWESISGDRLRTEIPLRIPNGESLGSQRVQIPLRAPANAYDLTVGLIANRQYPGDFIEFRRVTVSELGEPR